MDDAAAAKEEPWSARVRAHEEALQRRDPKSLNLAEAELHHRAATCGLSPREAQLLNEITLATGRS